MALREPDPHERTWHGSKRSGVIHLGPTRQWLINVVVCLGVLSRSMFGRSKQAWLDDVGPDPEPCERGKLLRIYYLQFDAETTMAVTASIKESSRTCVLNTPERGAELMKILASARSPANPLERFLNDEVRLKVVADDTEPGQCLVALVEGDGVVHRLAHDRRRGVYGVDQVLSKETMAELERWIKATCNWPKEH